VLPDLERLRGADAVGFLSYEAAFAFESSLAGTRGSGLPLLWFMTGADGEEAPPLPDGSGAWTSAPTPLIGREEYDRCVESIQQHILDGDIYQANYTFQSEVRVLGHPLAVYAQLRKRAGANWSAVIFTGEQWILSLSPELFFACDAEGQVTCRPMKGTAAAGSDPDALRNDPKQRSENLMIVDLLRNDLSRVARPFSVQVPEMFAVETYPTVLQMTSTVIGHLQKGLGAVDLLTAMFPCGSITGAPKIRAMEIIDQLEQSPRGIYTGSIGKLSADGRATFNVAIRTLVMREGEGAAIIGLGSGIVADSVSSDEWDECRRKGAFVATPCDFTLFETMRADPAGFMPDMEQHLDRLETSARTFGFDFDRSELRRRLGAHVTGPGRVRLDLAANGEVAIVTEPLPQTPEGAEVAVAERSVTRHDFRLRHKTSDRAFYDEPRLASGAFEVLFIDEEGFLTEGSFTNIFVPRDGKLVTPPLERGLLPGILRERLLANGEAMEADLRPPDLGEEFFIGNALRGLIPARLRKSAPQS
jgi:para-aminobenzoate synthetase/4-amino-4-deoxychorismate lyase